MKNLKHNHKTVGAFAIITNELNQILLIHRTDKDVRNLPWGKCEAHESPRDTVIRETLEETGFITELLYLHGVYFKYDKDDVVFCYVSTIISGEITLNDEADDIRRYDYDAIPSNLVEKHRARVDQYFSNPLPNSCIMMIQ